MDGCNKPLIVLTLCICTLLAGCASHPTRGIWPFNRDFTDTVPGIPSPSERIAVLRKMGKKAGWAKPDERERISAELAAAFPAETDPLIRMEIVRAAAGYQTASAASVLESALADSDADVRIVTCEAWGERGGAESVAKLSEVLARDVDVDVRLTAARALGETGDATAAIALGDALEDGDPAMQYLAVKSLRKVTGEKFDNDVNQWLQYVRTQYPTQREPVSVVERIDQTY